MPDIETDATTNTAEDLDLLNADETPEPESAPGEPEEVLDEQIEQPLKVEEKVADDTPLPSRPSISEIDEKFPEIFKTFPDLRQMYFREQEYSKLFPTIQDAREATENANAFQNLRSDIFEGDGTKFISALKSEGDEGFNKFVQNFLPSVQKVSQDAFWKAIAPTLQNVTRVFYNESVRNGNENAKNAALILSHFLFGETEVAEGKKSVVEEVKPVDNSVKTERAQWAAERYRAFDGEVKSSANEGLRSLISENLDPKELMTDFIKNSVIEKVINEIDSQLVADKAHMGYISSLWVKAVKEGYTGDWKSKIVSAYLARAKSLVPSIRAKYVSEALGTSVRRAKSVQSQVSNPRREGTTSGRPSGEGQKNYSPKSINYDKTSDEDLLNDNITYKN